MARAIWSGSISFGLVNIPVKLYTAVRDRDIHFHSLSTDGSCRLRRKMYCPETGKEYEWGETARGYEVAPDQYVIVTDEELAQLRPDKGRAIEIERFVALDEIDPMLFDRPYYLAPDKNGSKPYRLLLEALSKSRKVAVSRIVLRTKEYLAVVRPIGDALCLETLRYADEVVPISELNDIPEEFEIGDRELAMADQLIDHLTTEFDADAYRDEFRDRVQALIDAKAAGEELVVQEPGDTGARGNVINLMEALQKSLAAVGGEKGDSAEKAAPSGRAAAARRKADAEERPAARRTPARKKPAAKKSGKSSGTSKASGKSSRRKVA